MLRFFKPEELLQSFVFLEVRERDAYLISRHYTLNTPFWIEVFFALML